MTKSEMVSVRAERPIMRVCSVAILTLIAIVSMAQSITPPKPLSVTIIPNIRPTTVVDCPTVPTCIDNRSQQLRRNNYHAYLATGTGTWSVDMQFADGTPSGWSSFGTSGQVSNTSPVSGVGYGIGYHDFTRFAITGNATVTYSASKDYWSAGVTNTFSFPITPTQGGETFIDVRRYGAVEGGVVNNTAAYSAAMAALPANGGTLLVGPGVYAGTFAIPPYPKSITILCSGEDSTILQPALTNTPIVYLPTTVPNVSSGKFEIGKCSLKAHASGSTGSAIVLDGMVHPHLHDLTFLSNGSGNFAFGITQDTTANDRGATFNAQVEGLTVFLQSGPTTLVKTTQYASINKWSGIWVVSNTGMTKVFDFTATGTGGNILDSWICEGNLSAVCLLPGNNLVERSGYYEEDGGYVTGNAGNNNSFEGDTFSGHSPGTFIQGTFGENGWTFRNAVWGIIPDFDAAGLFNWQDCHANICRNHQGGYLSSKVSSISAYAVVVVPGGGTLSPTSCNGSGVCTYVITAVDEAGFESTGVTQASAHIVTGSNNSVNGQSASKNGPAGFNIYGPDCPTACHFLHEAPNDFNEENGIIFDNGSFTPTAQTPPTEDHTGDILSGNGLYARTFVNTVTDTSVTPGSIVGTLTGQAAALAVSPPVGFTVLIPAIANPIPAGSFVSFTLNGDTHQVNGTSNSGGSNFQCTLYAGTPLMLTWGGANAWFSPNCGANPTVAYVGFGNEQGANNALVAAGGNIALVAGQPIQINTSHTCGSGCTIRWNGVIYDLKSGYNAGNNITTTYQVGSIINATFDGTRFQDSRQ